MQRFDTTRMRLWRLPRWQTGLLAALAIGIGLAITIVATTLVLVITPIFLIVALALKYLPAQTKKRDAASSPPKVIDADYEIVPADSPADRTVIGSGRTWPPSE